ncbi:MAG TPA: methyltransferase domain-containing protein [Chitinophagales bacterium]|nr:methyltransferase domain-containing protein [Chitinophagales bacterium]
MKKWIQKAIVQKIVSYLPFGRQINYLFQKYVTKGVYLTDTYFYDRLNHATQHLAAYHRFTGNPMPNSCLELGTGWYPIVPIAFFLSGVQSIYSVDIAFLTSKKRIATTLAMFAQAHRQQRLPNYLPNLQPQRLQLLLNLIDQLPTLTLPDILNQLHLHYLIEDARHLSLPDNSVDLVNSNNTFEHIYPQLLEPILLEFKRVVKKNTGIMSHFIDMSDHFAHFDSSITIYNFLQFSDQQWQWIDNTIQPQNRLRLADYQQLYNHINLPITHQNLWHGDVAQLTMVPLHPHFANQNPDMVAVSHCHFISVM